MANATSSRFIDPAVLNRIGSLQLIAKTVVEGFVAGLHRSPYHGFSLDFAEYREYSPGDDIRTVDWKVFGRTDRFYVRKYQGDTNTQLYMLLDTSKSMDFSSHTLTKLDYARYLAAALAYLSTRQHDATGLLTFAAEIVHQIPPRPRQGQMFTIMHHLERLSVGERTNISGAMEALSRLIRKRSLVVLISDFYQELPELTKALRFFRHHGNDLILFHILDPMEITLPLGQISTLEDIETHEHLTYVPEYSRQGYMEALQAHIEGLRKECRDSYIEYELLNTEDPLDKALYRYLTLRGRRY
ncbi:MAG: DUF58 domain-containing protein [Acidobacteriota bacterium]